MLHFRSLFLFLCLFILTQCTVQKRVHRPGWHITWKKAHKQSSQQAQSIVLEKKEDEQQEDLEFSESVKKESTVDSVNIALGNDEIIVTKKEQESDPILTVLQSKSSSEWMKHYVHSEWKKNKELKAKPTWLAHNKWGAVALLIFLIFVSTISFLYFLEKTTNADGNLGVFFSGIIGLVFLSILMGILAILLLIALIAPSFEGQQNRKAKRESVKEQPVKKTTEQPTSNQETIEKNEAKTVAEPKTSPASGSTGKTFLAIGVGIFLIGLFWLMSK